MIINHRNKELIAICGNMASGKTELARQLQKNLDYEILSFAAPLKEIATKILGREIDKSKDRRFLINLGSYFKGHVDLVYPEEHVMGISEAVPDLKDNPVYFKDDVWTKLMVQKIRPDKRYVVDDLRFYVEYAILRENGFVITLIECMRNVCEERMVKRDGGFNPDIWQTPSEMEHKNFNNYDIILVSGNSPEDTYNTFMDKLGKL